MLYGYDELKKDAKEENEMLVLSLERLLFLNTIRGVHKKRYLDDAILIARCLSKEKYNKNSYIKNSYWENISNE